jgi:glutaconate CoA-transferase, subunit A
MTPVSKRTTMAQAIAELVTDGSSVALGLALEALIPFAAGHEMIRQRKRDLTLIGPISDILFDQLIGAGCVARVRAAWAGNVSAGLGHNYRRAAESGIPRRIDIEDYSNFTIALGLLAGALGAPYLPTKTLLGSDIERTNRSMRRGKSPFDNAELLLVPPIVPDVTVLHVQRADESGGSHAWGNLGVSGEGALAAKRVIVVAEEIVERGVIESDPNRVIVPPHRVSAVVCEPGGAHPSPVQGYYGRDHAFYHDYHTQSKTTEGNARFLDEWVSGIGGRGEYLDKLGTQRWSALQVRQQHLAAPVNYAAR